MDRVGIVLVCHSAALAEAALQLALAMVPGDPATVSLAAGTADGRLGTDPLRVADAIAAADSGSGVVVLSDLGSAVLSAEMALELGDPSHHAVLVAAPFVEGLLAALVSASGGAALAEVASAARQALAPKVSHLEGQPPSPGAISGSPEQGAAEPAEPAPSHTLRDTIVVVNAGGMHARPAAAIAALLAPLRAVVTLSNGRGASADGASPIALGLLEAPPGEQLTVTAVGQDAPMALQLLQQAFADGFGEERLTSSAQMPATGTQAMLTLPAPAAQTLSPVPVPPSAVAAPIPSRGLGVSPGRVCGPVRRLTGPLAPQAQPCALEPQRREAAVSALEAACGAVIEELASDADRAGGTGGAMLAALAAIASDPQLLQTAREAVLGEGLDAEQAWWRTLTRLVTTYRAAGGRRAERAADLLDLRDRVVLHLRGQSPARQIPGPATIWLAHDPGPLELATLTPGRCLGLVIEGGGPTCHAAILARELGIPAVCGAPGILALADGSRLLIDGDSGELVVDPRGEVRVGALAVQAAQALTAQGTTADGVAIALLANVSGVRDSIRAAALGAEGVGLLRTEFCFPDPQQEPQLADQIALYSEIFAAWSGRRVLIRTLDAGADKPLAYLTGDPEPNPALGLRGWRTARRRPQVLERQLQAIAAASRTSDAEVWVMAPMIATAGEAASFVAQARAAGLQRAGVMVETPAAALTGDALCAAVDFVSVGTNDLLQYTMAADRGLTALADLNTPWQPSLLRLISLLIQSARRCGTPVGVCGEAAGLADLAPVLVGLGVRSLSMAPGSLHGVSAALAGVSLATAEAMAAAALQAGSAQEAMQKAWEASRIAGVASQRSPMGKP